MANNQTPRFTESQPSLDTHPHQRAWRLVVLLTILAFFLSAQYLNHTGFCYTEGKYLSDQEIIDRFLFRQAAADMSFEEKANALKNRNGGSYPYCCRLKNDPLLLDWFDEFVNKLFGRYLLEVEIISQNDDMTSRNSDPYRTDHITITSCGVPGHDSYGQSISEYTYELKISENKAYWQQIMK